jgi:hypothetical protein
MLVKSILVLATAALAAASPSARRQRRQACTPKPPTRASLPVNGGARELAAPPPDAPIEFILIGHGIQNYTCAAVGGEAKATGALAVLYDATSLHPGFGDGAVDIESFDAITSTALHSLPVPLNLIDGAVNRVAGSRGADGTNPFPEPAPLVLDGYDSIPFAGHHIFTSAGTPQFIVDAGINFLGKKADGIPAPSGATPGPEGTGTVDWLQLSDAGGSVGARFVYRVVTAGGKPHTCDIVGDDSVSYTAQYWFFS